MGKLTRAFVCIEFSDEVVKEVARVQGLVGKIKFTGKMTELENLHLTLKFLGEIDDVVLEKVRERLKKVEFEEMELKLGRSGMFSRRGVPRIVWIKIEGKQIFELQKRVDGALEGLFKPEERFMSHLTVARVKYVKDKKGFLEHVRGIKVRPVGFDVKGFSLKSSELKTVGPVYRDLEVIKSKG